MKETVKQMLMALAAADNKVATIRGELKQAEAEYDAVEDRVFAYLDEQGTDQVRAPKAGLTVSISETEAPFIEDFDLFSKFLLRRKAVELLQRRLSAPAVRDLMEQLGGKKLPGVGIFNKRRLSVTKSKK